MKYGVSLKIDVTKLDKSRFFHADSGAIYVDCTLFLKPDEADQYGYHGGITQAKNKDEDVQMPFVGNAKIFWTGESQGQSGQNQSQGNQGIPRNNQREYQEPAEDD